MFVNKVMGLRHKRHIVLSKAQVDLLWSMTSASNIDRNTKIQILFDLNADMSIKIVAFNNGVCITKVNIIIANFKKYGAACVHESYYSRPAKKLTKKVRDKIDELITTTPPNGRKHWSNQGIIKELIRLKYVKSLHPGTLWRYTKNNSNFRKTPRKETGKDE